MMLELRPSWAMGIPGQLCKLEMTDCLEKNNKTNKKA